MKQSQLVGCRLIAEQIEQHVDCGEHLAHSEDDFLISNCVTNSHTVKHGHWPAKSHLFDNRTMELGGLPLKHSPKAD